MVLAFDFGEVVEDRKDVYGKCDAKGGYVLWSVGVFDAVGGGFRHLLNWLSLLDFFVGLTGNASAIFPHSIRLVKEIHL
jgi:hypothetical protein